MAEYVIYKMVRPSVGYDSEIQCTAAIENARNVLADWHSFGTGEFLLVHAKNPLAPLASFVVTAREERQVVTVHDVTVTIARVVLEP